MGRGGNISSDLKQPIGHELSDYERSRYHSMRLMASAILNRLSASAQLSIARLVREQKELTGAELARPVHSAGENSPGSDALSQLIHEGLIHASAKSLAKADTRQDLCWRPSPLGEATAELICERGGQIAAQGS